MMVYNSKVLFFFLTNISIEMRMHRTVGFVLPSQHLRIIFYYGRNLAINTILNIWIHSDTIVVERNANLSIGSIQSVKPLKLLWIRHNVLAVIRIEQVLSIRITTEWIVSFCDILSFLLSYFSSFHLVRQEKVHCNSSMSATLNAYSWINFAKTPASCELSASNDSIESFAMLFFNWSTCEHAHAHRSQFDLANGKRKRE